MWEELTSAYPDFTKAFFEYLYYNELEVWQGEKQENRIKTMPLIVLGTSGIGKTTLAKNIMQKIQGWYDPHGVCLVYTNEVALGELIEYAFQIRFYLADKFKGEYLPSVYVLTFDDATAVKVEPAEVRRFFSIRHVAQELSGVNEGIIYSVFLTHDWYSLHKIFRRFARTAIVLSVPSLDTFARRQIGSLLGKDVIKILQDIAKKALKEDRYKGVGFVKLPYIPDGYDTDVGIIRFKRTDAAFVKIRPYRKDTLHFDRARLELYVPKEKKEKKEIARLKERLEKERKQTRERMRRYRARQKSALEEGEEEEKKE